MSAASDAFLANLAAAPLIAILRGLRPEEALDVGEALFDAGFRILEVPLNSPRPLDSIRILSARFVGSVSVGAGTVLSVADVDAVVEAGGTLIISPNFAADVMLRALTRGAVALPGVTTPSEAFAALGAGAAALKLFPAEMLPPAAVKAMLAVLPEGTRLIPVGGIGASNIGAYRAAGAAGFGLGSSLFKPGDDVKTVASKARALTTALRG
jgi:2-dehydro-3-deoxyphosphogalactonate aldolase